jgi:hypothetical protein
MEFSCNVSLPDYLGIGKGCSVGWGVIKGIGEKKNPKRPRFVRKIGGDSNEHGLMI